MSRASFRVLGLSSEDAELGSKVGDREIFVSDRIDQATVPDAKMTVGFARVGRGERLEISFPYDEVLIVTKGSYSVRTEHGELVTARAGEAIYLPAGSSNASHAEEDTGLRGQPALGLRRPRGDVLTGRGPRPDRCSVHLDGEARRDRGRHPGAAGRRPRGARRGS
jgi:uncharacterized cupin superfamily protein